MLHEMLTQLTRLHHIPAIALQLRWMVLGNASKVGPPTGPFTGSRHSLSLSLIPIPLVWQQ